MIYGRLKAVRFLYPEYKVLITVSVSRLCDSNLIPAADGANRL